MEEQKDNFPDKMRKYSEPCSSIFTIGDRQMSMCVQNWLIKFIENNLH